MLHLIKKAQREDDKAFLSLFQRYEQDIYRIAFLYVKNENDALDVVQESAYRSFKSIKNLKQPKYFKTWLMRIAINCALDFLRKQKNMIQMKPDFEEFISEEVNEDIDLEITLRDLLERLNEVEKSVIILRFYEGMTIKETAKTLDLPLGTTKTILYRALTQLRKNLKGDGDDEQKD